MEGGGSNAVSQVRAQIEEWEASNGALYYNGGRYLDAMEAQEAAAGRRASERKVAREAHKREPGAGTPSPAAGVAATPATDGAGAGRKVCVSVRLCMCACL